MTDVSMSPVVHHDVEICAGGGHAAPGVGQPAKAETSKITTR